jgi:hypothetical protein
LNAIGSSASFLGRFASSLGSGNRHPMLAICRGRAAPPENVSRRLSVELPEAWT